jgi:hypothetical protein
MQGIVISTNDITQLVRECKQGLRKFDNKGICKLAASDSSQAVVRFFLLNKLWRNYNYVFT